MFSKKMLIPSLMIFGISGFVLMVLISTVGFASKDGELPWSQMMIAGVVSLLIVSIGIALKRRHVILGNK